MLLSEMASVISCRDCARARLVYAAKPQITECFLGRRVANAKRICKEYEPKKRRK